MNNPCVSIIVPVYNSEKYLNRCIESILHQDFDNFELILIDDGSTDRSVGILDRYKQEDPRITVVHKENTGVSDSRNIGIQMAKGEYIRFLDSDDWITPDSTRLLVNCAVENQSDLVIADFYRVYKGKVSRKGNIENKEVMTRLEFAQLMMENPADFYYGVLWNKLYRRDLIKRYELKMLENVSWCEDFIFNLEYIRVAERFVALQVPIYYYEKRKDGLSAKGSSFSKGVEMKLYVFKFYDNFYRNVYPVEYYEENRASILKFFISGAQDGSVPLGSKRMEIADENYLNGLYGESEMISFYRRVYLLEYLSRALKEKYDLNESEINVLAVVCSNKNSVSREVLVNCVRSGEAKARKAIASLLQKGYIAEEIVKCEVTHRRKRVYHVQKSLLSDDIEHLKKEYENIIFRRISDQEREMYLKVRKQIDKNINDFLTH